MKSSNAIVANALSAFNADPEDLAAVKRRCRTQAQKIVSDINGLVGAAEGYIDYLPADFRKLYKSVADFRLEVERLIAACR
jgi:hypothetical protein